MVTNALSLTHISSLVQWCSKAFKNVNVVPPDVGAVHQVNLEYLSQVVQLRDGFIFPDSLVGTDSHTTMINGLGILGWGVGGIESEAVMLGQPVTLTLPRVVGCKLLGSIHPLATSIDIVLGITKSLDFGPSPNSETFLDLLLARAGSGQDAERTKRGCQLYASEHSAKPPR
ncbi:hypothetical protein WMY93_023745 [Mugilogobius chulae]|uniref:Aconitase/3-isopropylmalate dehydratase large subunit alpha/beta/alpha domain-containing protein n=1 Tax=Mugilogobius chulae TaxID=88201 RepID=A0AAW0NHA8_9GOBI